jgi:hypothetical protein
MSDLASAVCSITPTQRRRFFWAAWWTGSPQHSPFRRPDASNGAARTMEEALAEAQRAAGRNLVVIEPYWARAWTRVLRGEAPPPLPHAQPRPIKHTEPRRPRSAWSILGLEPGATITEVKRAFRKCALDTHPDRGGDAEDFLEVRRAYEKLIVELAVRSRKRPAK